MGKKLREIVILHSNDIHGKFTGYTDEDGKKRGSLAQVAGYVSKIRNSGWRCRSFTLLMPRMYSASVVMN